MTAAHGKARNREHHVLIVDDEEIVLVALRETLRQRVTLFRQRRLEDQRGKCSVSRKAGANDRSPINRKDATSLTL